MIKEGGDTQAGVLSSQHMFSGPRKEKEGTGSGSETHRHVGVEREIRDWWHSNNSNSCYYWKCLALWSMFFF